MARPYLAIVFFLLATSTFTISMARKAPEIAPAPFSVELVQWEDEKGLERTIQEIAPAPFPIQWEDEKSLMKIILGPFGLLWCIPAVAKVTGCAADLSNSYNTGKIHISKECCNAITDISDSCFSVYGSVFAILLNQYCDSL